MLLVIYEAQGEGKYGKLLVKAGLNVLVLWNLNDCGEMGCYFTMLGFGISI